MRVSQISINNFRGIESASIILPGCGVLIGDNNTGKTTVLEALNLVLGPDRLNRFPPIDEHDFYRGQYLFADQGEKLISDDLLVEVNQNLVDSSYAKRPDGPLIEIVVTVIDLSEDQRSYFLDKLEFWNTEKNEFYVGTKVEGIDSDNVSEALRVTFHGWYEKEEDDFQGKTYFTRSLTESEIPDEFRKKDKLKCGFLYLRSLRTGTRALSLERGSLLDIILQQRDIRPEMWEDTIDKLANLTVADKPELGISEVLKSIDASFQKYVPREWGIHPHLKVSKLTRDHLRSVITAFIATSEGDHAAPFYRQGTGTIHMLLLAMLSIIADNKPNVIFAMEEPETSIPPYAQKQIVHGVRSLASQALFTSHSPYVLEEFSLDETVVLNRDKLGLLTRQYISLPSNLKLNKYRKDFRNRFCEGLLSRRILIAEGETETIVFPLVCRRLAELNADDYKTLEALGICVIDATGERNIAGLAHLFVKLGKRVYAICDKQNDSNFKAICDEVNLLFMHDEKGIEDLVVKQTTEAALQRFSGSIEWPEHILQKFPNPNEDLQNALTKFFQWKKGNSRLADFLAQCEEEEIPTWLKESCRRIVEDCERDFSKEANSETVAE